MRSMIVMLMAATVDGKIARHSDHFPDWTGSPDKRMFKTLTMQAGVVIMGSRTFDNIGGPLPGRKHVVLTRHPEKRKPIAGVSFTADAPPQIAAGLYKQGYKQAVLAGGTMVNTLFARAGLIDEVIITIAPRLFGQGLSLFNAPVNMELALEDCHLIETNTVYLKYKVVNVFDKQPPLSA